MFAGVYLRFILKLNCSNLEDMYIERSFEYDITDKLLGKVTHRENINLEMLEELLLYNTISDFILEVVQNCYINDFTQKITTYNVLWENEILIKNLFENYIDEIFWQDFSLLEVETLKRIK